jgi:replicative DNA helicase
LSYTETYTPKVALLGDLISDFTADMEAAALARKSGIPRGPVTHFKELDSAISGYLAPGIHIVQAAPGAGKSAWCLQVAAHCGFPALYVTAEMHPLELLRRTVARETGTFLNRLKSGEFGLEAAIDLAARTAEKIPHLAFLDGTRGYATPELIRDTAADLRERTGHEHVLIVIDSLHVWARSARSVGSEVASSEYELLNAGLRALTQIASELACPILAVAHRNRAGQKEGGMHSSKGSGGIEYEAETVIELTYKTDIPDAAHNNEVNLAIHKNRHGELKKEIPLVFSGPLQKFSEHKHGSLL